MHKPATIIAYAYIALLSLIFCHVNGTVNYKNDTSVTESTLNNTVFSTQELNNHTEPFLTRDVSESIVETTKHRLNKPTGKNQYVAIILQRPDTVALRKYVSVDHYGVHFEDIPESTRVRIELNRPNNNPADGEEPADSKIILPDEDIYHDVYRVFDRLFLGNRENNQTVGGDQQLLSSNIYNFIKGVEYCEILFNAMHKLSTSSIAPLPCEFLHDMFESEKLIHNTTENVPLNRVSADDVVVNSTEQPSAQMDPSLIFIDDVLVFLYKTTFYLPSTNTLSLYRPDAVMYFSNKLLQSNVNLYSFITPYTENKNTYEMDLLNFSYGNHTNFNINSTSDAKFVPVRERALSSSGNHLYDALHTRSGSTSTDVEQETPNIPPRHRRRKRLSILPWFQERGRHSSPEEDTAWRLGRNPFSTKKKPNGKTLQDKEKTQLLSETNQKETVTPNQHPVVPTRKNWKIPKKTSTTPAVPDSASGVRYPVGADAVEKNLIDLFAHIPDAYPDNAVDPPDITVEARSISTLKPTTGLIFDRSALASGESQKNTPSLTGDKHHSPPDVVSFYETSLDSFKHHKPFTPPGSSEQDLEKGAFPHKLASQFSEIDIGVPYKVEAPYIPQVFFPWEEKIDQSPPLSSSNSKWSNLENAAAKDDQKNPIVRNIHTPPEQSSGEEELRHSDKKMKTVHNIEYQSSTPTARLLGNDQTLDDIKEFANEQLDHFDKADSQQLGQTKNTHVLPDTSSSNYVNSFRRLGGKRSNPIANVTNGRPNNNLQREHNYYRLPQNAQRPLSNTNSRNVDPRYSRNQAPAPGSSSSRQLSGRYNGMSKQLYESSNARYDRSSSTTTTTTTRGRPIRSYTVGESRFYCGSRWAKNKRRSLEQQSRRQNKPDSYGSKQNYDSPCNETPVPHDFAGRQLSGRNSSTSSTTTTTTTRAQRIQSYQDPSKYYVGKDWPTKGPRSLEQQSRGQNKPDSYGSKQNYDSPCNETPVPHDFAGRQLSGRSSSTSSTTTTTTRAQRIQPYLDPSKYYSGKDWPKKGPRSLEQQSRRQNKPDSYGSKQNYNNEKGGSSSGSSGRTSHNDGFKRFLTKNMLRKGRRLGYEETPTVDIYSSERKNNFAPSKHITTRPAEEFNEIDSIKYEDNKINSSEDMEPDYKLTEPMNKRRLSEIDIYNTIASPLETKYYLKSTGRYLHSMNNLEHDFHDHNHGLHDHNHEDHDHYFINNKLLIWNKVGAGALLLMVGLVGCIIGLIWSKTLNNKLSQMNSNKFTFKLFLKGLICGTLFGLSLFHLIPEAFEINSKYSIWPAFQQHHFNLTWVYVFLGFVLTLICSQILLTDGHCKSNAIPNEVQYDSVQHSNEYTVLNKDKVTYKCYSQFISVLLSALTVSIHCLYEGFVVGTLITIPSMWTAAAAIAAHKWAVGFSLISYYSSMKFPLYILIIVLIVFVLSSPIGLICGCILSTLVPSLNGFISAVGGGALLYISWEILYEDCSNTNSTKMTKIAHVSSMCTGAIFLLIITLIHHIFVEHVH